MSFEARSRICSVFRQMEGKWKRLEYTPEYTVYTELIHVKQLQPEALYYWVSDAAKEENPSGPAFTPLNKRLNGSNSLLA